MVVGLNFSLLHLSFGLSTCISFVRFPSSNMSANFVHLIVVVAVIAAYTVLTALGHDGNILFGILAGQGVGVGIEKTFSTPTYSPPTIPPSRSTIQ